MKVFRSISNLDKREKVIGLGNFDGLHKGHMALVDTLIKESDANGMDSMIYTFVKHPENILRKKLFTPLLTAVDKKIQLLGKTRLDSIYLEEFDERYSRMEPLEFVKSILVNKLNARVVVAGFNYHFGYKGVGDVKLLAELGEKFGFDVKVVPPVRIDGEIVSSTIIRGLVTRGEMKKASKYLGRNYSITGKVQPGKNLGSRLGFPTANIHPENYLVLPKTGVYVSRTNLGGNIYKSITNIGINPTVSKAEMLSVETHILDFYQDIYGCNIEISFLKMLRNEIKFKNKEALAKQVEKDIKNASDYNNGA